MLLRRWMALFAALALTASWFGPKTQAAEPKNGPADGKTGLASPGDRARVSLFGVKAEGAKFVYVLDRSGSTEGKLLAAAKAEILASIENIDEVHQFQIVVYNEPQGFQSGGAQRASWPSARTTMGRRSRGSSNRSRPTAAPIMPPPCRWRSACGPT